MHRMTLNMYIMSQHAACTARDSCLFTQVQLISSTRPSYATSHEINCLYVNTWCSGLGYAIFGAKVLFANTRHCSVSLADMLQRSLIRWDMKTLRFYWTLTSQRWLIRNTGESVVWKMPIAACLWPHSRFRLKATCSSTGCVCSANR
jgi:hypothetical protein